MGSQHPSPNARKPSAILSRELGQKWSHHMMPKVLVLKAQGRHVMWSFLAKFWPGKITSRDGCFLRGPAAILFISRDTCSDSIAKLFRACFHGVSHDDCAILCKMGIAAMCLCETKYNGGLSHHFGGVLASLRKHRATLRAQRSQKKNLDWNCQSRLKISIALEMFNPGPSEFPTKSRGLVGGSLENFNVDWRFQSLRAILNFPIFGPLGNMEYRSDSIAVSLDMGPLRMLPAD